MSRFRRPPPIPGRMFELGDLPPPLDHERAEGLPARPRPPIGSPPRAGKLVPGAGGGLVDTTPSDIMSNWQNIVFTTSASVGEVTPVQDFTERKFLIIQNRSAAGTIYVGFGWAPNANNSLLLPAGIGFEPFRYPTNPIYVAGSAASLSGLIIYGT